MSEEPLREELWNQRLIFSNTVFSIAEAFVSLANPDEIINSALERLGAASKAGRTYLFLIDEDGETMDNTQEWCNEGVEPAIEDLQGLPVSMFPWWIGLLSEGQIIDIDDVSDMGDEAKAEREILEMQDIKSVLVLPVMIDGVLAGFVGLDNVHSASGWDEETKHYLHVAADMIGMTIKRNRNEQQIIKQKEELAIAYEHLKATQAQLLRQEKLASIGQLAAGIAHEINNPVGYVRGNSVTLEEYIGDLSDYIRLCDSGAAKEDLVKLRKELDIDFILEDIRELVSSNISGLQRIADIVVNLRNFSRVDDQGFSSQVDVEEGIRSTIAVAGSELKDMAEISTDFDGVGFVKGNGGELNQVFLNLLINSAQAIRAAKMSGSGNIRISTRREDGNVIILCEDNGPGIPEEAVGRIFDPFFTTKDVGEGTGLGLSISYDIIVNRHGGMITAENKPEGGAVFRIELPAK